MTSPQSVIFQHPELKALNVIKPETFVPLKVLLEIHYQYFDCQKSKIDCYPDWLNSKNFKQYLKKRGIKRLELSTKLPLALIMGEDVFQTHLEKET